MIRVCVVVIVHTEPDAEVIALSPRTLMATNRFVCEVCHKGFQREQNLQLHRRGHNLPWKLKQKDPKEARRRVYLCPEPTCVHHNPSRALGDLMGIKKHYCRKHGEKTLKCGKCDKLYAVEADWKAHSKTCGTREYRCDACGELSSPGPFNSSARSRPGPPAGLWFFLFCSSAYRQDQFLLEPRVQDTHASTRLDYSFLAVSS